MVRRSQAAPRAPAESPQPAIRTRRPAVSPRDFWLGLAIVGLVLLAYSRALSGGFIWDDDAHLTENPCIVGPLGLKEIWTTAHMRICPLVQTSFWLEYRLWGLAPQPFHLVNILLHAAAAVVLWRVLRMLRVPGAWLGAALWALHPVQVESVAWITEMKNTQSALFFLLAVLFFCKARRADAPEGRPGLCYALTLAFATLALASKSSTVVLPLILGLCAWWIDRRWRWRRNLLQLAPVLLLSIGTGLITMWTQRAEGAFDPEFARSFAERLAGVGVAVWFYLGKLLWPHPLIFIYPRWRIDPAHVAAYLPTLAMVALIAVFWWQRNRWARSAFFAGAFFVAALSPVLGLIDTFFWRYSFVGDHFQYLASMGPLALAGAGLTAGLHRIGSAPRWLMGGLGALLLVAPGVLSWRQSAMYRSDEVLWTTTLERNPASWIAHNNLAVDLSHRPDRTDEAIAHFEAALRLRPSHARAHFNLAQVLEKIPGRQNDAIAQYELAVRIDPNFGEAHQNLAVRLSAQPGRQAGAIAHYEQALRLMPASAESHYDLAIELAKLSGPPADIIRHYREAVRLKPDFAEAHYNLALMLARQPASATEAAAHFESALRLRPDWPEAHNNYAILLSDLPGRLPEAIAHYEQALRLRPGDPRLHDNLAGAWFHTGRLAEAISELETALKLDPGNEAVRQHLAIVQQQLRSRNGSPTPSAQGSRRD